MTTTVKWRWAEPGEDRDHVEDHQYEWASDKGVDVAASIVQNYIEANGTDGCETFEVEIISPVRWAGIYDVGLDWEPHAYATKQQPSDSDQPACARQPEPKANGETNLATS